MIDIQIVPIFNQAAPRVWHDFAHVRSASASSGYIPAEAWCNICTEAKKLQQTQLSLAFGAYLDSKMVGFIQADAGMASGYINALYVLPEYQRHGIGRALLTATEVVNSCYVDKLFIISSDDGHAFYQSSGYAWLVGGGNLYYKNLPARPKSAVVPIFHCNKELTRSFRRIGASFDPDIVNSDNRPVFAHFDAQAVLDGYVVNHGTGSDFITHTDSETCHMVLANKYMEYIRAAANIHTH